MRHRNVDIRDLTVRELEEELKIAKKFRSNVESIINSYEQIQKDFGGYFKIKTISKSDFFKSVYKFFKNLSDLIISVKDLIEEDYITREHDIDGDEPLQILLQICVEIAKYKEFFEEKEKKELVDSDICIIIALIHDVITYMKINVGWDLWGESIYYEADMIASFYDILFIEGIEESNFGKFPVKYGVMYFLKRTGYIHEGMFEDDWEDSELFEEDE